MARVSFTLRRTDADKGSYLRYDDSLGVRTDADSALRADGVQLAPDTFTVSTFAATAVTYGTVDLSWEVPIVTSLSATPEVTGIVLVYSATGSPQTIASGTILVESDNTFSYIHSGLTQGRWAYYTLFLHYQSNAGDSFYEKAASLSVLVPRDYGSTMALWNRIPLFYRVQDTSLGDLDYEPSDFPSSLSSGTVIGPLFRFLSIFGFEMDRMRTMLDYQMVSYDPALSNEEHLDALSSMLGVGMQSSDLGGTRLRSLLNYIGVFRRSKGTPSGTEFVGQALTGGDMLIDQNGYDITIYSQRVNHITVPKTGTGITTHRAAYNTEVTSPAAFSTDMSAYSGTYSVSTNTFTTTGTGASVGVQHVMLHLSSPIPVQLNDFVGFSVQGTNVGASAIKWARLVNGAGTVMGSQSVSTNVAGTRVFEISVTSNASAGTWTNAYVEYLVDLSAVSSFTNSNLLAERNYLGSYFDGDTVRGGWLVDASSVSDYRWAGSANSSRSLFAEDYKRTNGILDALLLDVFPITEAPKYTIVSYNAVPGV